MEGCGMRFQGGRGPSAAGSALCDARPPVAAMGRRSKEWRQGGECGGADGLSAAVGGKGTAPAFRCRHRRTLSHDSAMSTWTPRSTPRSSLGSDSDVSSPPKRIACVEERLDDRDLPPKYGCRRRTLTEDEATGECTSARKASAREAVSAGVEERRRARGIQKEVDSLRQRLLEAEAKCSSLEIQCQEATRRSEELQFQAVEQSGKLEELEAKYTIESQRANDLEGACIHQEAALVAAQDEIVALGNDLAVKDDVIDELEGRLASECQSHQDTKERVHTILMQHQAIAVQVQNGFMPVQAQQPRASVESSAKGRAPQGASQSPKEREQPDSCNMDEVSKGTACRVGSQCKGQMKRSKKELAAAHARKAQQKLQEKGELEIQSLSHQVEDQAQEIAILREQLHGKSEQLLMAQEQLEGYMDEVDKQLAAAWHELKDEKLRSKMLQEKLDKVKADTRRPAGRTNTSRSVEKATNELEMRLAEAKAKGDHLTGVTRSALSMVSSRTRSMTADQVATLRSLLKDALSVSEGLLETCTAQLSVPHSLPSPGPSQVDWDKTGVPGLMAMVDELRNQQPLAQMTLGHSNPKQKIQYHIRLKQELEELRRDYTKQLRERGMLEQCIKYLAGRCQLYEGFCIGEDVSSTQQRRGVSFDAGPRRVSADADAGTHQRRASLDSRRVKSRVSSEAAPSSARKVAGKRAAPGRDRTSNKKNRVASEQEIHDIQMQTLYEAAALLGDMAEMKEGGSPYDEYSDEAPQADGAMGYCDFSSPPTGKERRLLQKVAAVCIRSDVCESLDVGRPLFLDDD